MTLAPSPATLRRPDASMEDVIDRLLFIARVEKGIAEADADKTLPPEEIVKRMKR